MSFPSSFTVPWRDLVLSHREARSGDVPNYHTAEAVDALITTSIPRSLHIGTGESIFSRAICPALASARHSVHFVTCFWAASPSLDALSQALRDLALSRRRLPQPPPTLHVTIGLSSRSLVQKLLHTSSPSGHIYPPSRWRGLGLPDEASLRAGAVEMTVKSLFFTPFSVLHPKYLVVDETRAWLPSCNVCWERWLEGCVELHGDAVLALLNFHARVWGPNTLGASPLGTLPATSQTHLTPPPPTDAGEDAHSATQALRLSGTTPVPTILLPSPHHRNPGFSLFSRPRPPMTPLNAALLTLFANASREIHIVSPNITSPPVIDALLAALSRGVNVQIRTSRNLMLLEQLLTAGTTTAWCLRRMVRKYRSMLDARPTPEANLEAQLLPLGALDIFYYRPLESRARKSCHDEPLASHFKMTMVDGDYLLLGSGNMDRASWWTSQELGVLLFLPGCREREVWEGVLAQRTEPFYQSGH